MSAYRPLPTGSAEAGLLPDNAVGSKGELLCSWKEGEGGFSMGGPSEWTWTVQQHSYRSRAATEFLKWS